ncbi:MAG TPA: glycosyltransferase, partial [Pirellulaceae bacterium]
MGTLPRLVLVIPRWTPGSAEFQARSIAQRFKADWDVHLVSGPSGPLAGIAPGTGVTHHVLPHSRFAGAIQPWEFWRLLRALRPDIVHFFRPPRIRGALLATLSLPSIGTIVDVRSLDRNEPWWG